MTWYEWGLYLSRLEYEQDKEQARIEAQWAQTRILWAAIMNTGFKGPKKRVKSTDLIRLSFDDDDKEEELTPLTDKEMKMKFGSKLKKDGGA